MRRGRGVWSYVKAWERKRLVSANLLLIGSGVGLTVGQFPLGGKSLSSGVESFQSPL